MAKLNNIKRIIVEDFPKDQQDTISKLGFIINNTFEQLNQMLNKSLTISDNINEDIASVDVQVDSDGIPLIKTEFKTVLKGSCAGLQVINVINTTKTGVPPLNCPFITFEQLSTGLINIKNITGLQPNTKYTLTIRVTGK